MQFAHRRSKELLYSLWFLENASAGRWRSHEEHLLSMCASSAQFEQCTALYDPMSYSSALGHDEPAWYT